LKGRGNQYFELGIGTTFILDYYQPDRDIPMDRAFRDYVKFAVLRIGYRYQKDEGGTFFKAAFTPLAGFSWNNASDFNLRNMAPGRSGFAYPMIALAVGYTIKKN